MSEVIIPVNHPIKGVVTLPGSKSLVNRVLIMAALASGNSIISNMLFSDDSIACLNALKALGVHLKIDQDNKQVHVIGCNRHFNVSQKALNLL